MCPQGTFSQMNSIELKALIFLGFYGEYCEMSYSSDKSYYGKIKCGGNITDEVVIATPNYPERKHDYESCFWWIQVNPLLKFDFILR